MSQGSEAETGLPAGYRLREEWEVTPRRLAAEMAGDRRPLLIDCRTPEEHAVARIEGAVLIPMGELAGRLEELEVHRESRIVVHCHRGQRSLRVASFLRGQGFSDVWSLAGGIDAWSTGVDPSVARY